MIVRIPTEKVIPVIDEYLTGIEADYPMQLLAERLGAKADTLWNIYNRRAKTVEIGFVDRLFCVMGNPIGYWHMPEFRSYYELLGANEDEVPTPDGICERPGCSKPLSVDGRAPKSGPTRKRFCSNSCKVRAGQVRRGEEKRPSEGIRYVCRGGHERTPENTYRRPNGVMQCRDCMRTARREREVVRGSR